MPKPYDAASKDLIGWRPADYLALAGLPVPADPAGVVMLDAELSIVTASASADKLIRVDGLDDGPYLAVVEFQSSPDPRLDDRMALYNGLARWRYDLPVRNVVYLLRRAALSRGTSGQVVGPGLRFDYQLIPVWTLSPAHLLAGPIGTVPLALLADQPAAERPTTVDRVVERIRADAAADKLKDVLAQSAILIGLLNDEFLAERLMQSVVDMEDSIVYKAIVRKGVDLGFAQGREEGREQGREEGLEQGLERGRQLALMDVATKRLGPPSAAVRQQLSTSDGAKRLEDRLLTATTWDELLAD